MGECRVNGGGRIAGLLMLFSISLTGCGSAVVNGLLEYADKDIPTTGDSVYVRLYGCDSCGATILGVGEDHTWQYPPKNKKRNLRLWSKAQLPSLDPEKGKDAPTFVFEAVKREDTLVISTLAERVQYPAYRALPKKERIVRLVYETQGTADTTRLKTNQEIEHGPR